MYVSILYLRCGDRIIAPSRRRVDGFNSLFEMHAQLLPNRCLLNYDVSILYLRCAVCTRQLPSLSAPTRFNSLFEMREDAAGQPFWRHDGCFNSLFEMRRRRSTSAPCHSYRVSILYLRCLSYPSRREGRRPRRVSILYLRCSAYAPLPPPYPPLSFNSLFEMRDVCVFMLSPTRTFSRFNSLFEMQPSIMKPMLRVNLLVSILYLRC